MANNVIMRSLSLTTEFQPLSSQDMEVATVDISAPPSNDNSVLFLGDDGTEVPWIPGEFHTLVRVNLADIRVKAQNAGDIVTVVGGSW
jgi:hypothetical protein